MEASEEQKAQWRDELDAVNKRMNTRRLRMVALVQDLEDKAREQEADQVAFDDLLGKLGNPVVSESEEETPEDRERASFSERLQERLRETHEYDLQNEQFERDRQRYASFPVWDLEARRSSERAAGPASASPAARPASASHAQDAPVPRFVKPKPKGR